jgi:tetratricopeptide (TPR) repeat protein
MFVLELDVWIELNSGKLVVLLALAIDPSNLLVLAKKGSALPGLENYTGAINYYDKALAINPNDILTLLLLFCYFCIENYICYVLVLATA